MTYSLYKVRKPRMTKFGQGVGVRAHYPTLARNFLYCCRCPGIYLVRVHAKGEKKTNVNVNIFKITGFENEILIILLARFY